MARSGDPASEIWGTLEDLLLAFAVSRHGTRSWDSVAMEVRTRTPSAHHLLLTPERCKERYRDLQCRFSAADGEIDGVGDGGDGCGGPGLEVPWLEELRNLRVAELRREVQRHDVSIVSVQLKIRRLKDERERSLQEGEDSEGEPDLKDKDERKDVESPGSTPGNVPGDRTSGGDSGRSCKESNSTDPKEEAKPDAGLGGPEAAPGAEDRGADPTANEDSKSVGEASYNGSSNTIAKAAAEVNLARPPAVGEFGESVAESKGGEAEAEAKAEVEGAKETSDLHSSARLSRRGRGRWRRRVVSGSSSGEDEPEADAVSPVRKRVAAESQPLIAFLEVIRTDKYGSVFERRLEGQRSVRYRSLIRRHVDLEMVRTKLERGRAGQAYGSVEYFRDLLLLCYNAIVFYPKSSPEFIAAVHLRGLVTKEMARTIRNAARPPKAEEPTRPAHPLPPPPPVSKLKSDADRCASKPLHKPTSLVPLIACRKRSSLSGLAAGTKGEKQKSPVDRKERELEDETATKKRTKERSIVSGPRGLRSNKTRVKAENRVSGVSKSPNSISTPTAKSTGIENSVEPMAKSEKKIGGSVAVSASKKRGAAEFLNRMKRSSPTSNRTLLNTPRSSASSSGGGKGGERLKKVGRGNGKKDRDSRQPTGAATSKRAAKPSVTVKRSVGRPPKRAAARPTPPLAKKAKVEVGRTSPPSRKRGRR